MFRTFVENGACTVDTEDEDTWNEISEWARDSGRIETIIDKNWRNHQCQKTMLHDAANRGLQLEVSPLLDAGACIDIDDKNGGRPLLQAIDIESLSDR